MQSVGYGADSTGLFGSRAASMLIAGSYGGAAVFVALLLRDHGHGWVLALGLGLLAGFLAAALVALLLTRSRGRCSPE